jgi:amidase
MRAEGAIVIGKTNVPMFGLGGHSTNRVFGVTKNPYDRRARPGGSSGGAGAALATGLLIALADGSDMMGSLRNPAAWNGVYGFRPTVGLIPRDGVPGTPGYGVSTLGPWRARSAISRRFWDDVGRRVFRDRPWQGRAPAQPRIGWLGDWGGAYPMEQGILALAEAALARMEGAGWVVEPVAPPVSRELLWDAWTDMRAFAVAQDLVVHWRDPEARAALNPQAIYEIERGLALTGEALARALELRDNGSRRSTRSLPATTRWSCPHAALALPGDWDWPREIAGVAMDTYHRWMEVVVPASLAGLPALGMPAGLGESGLPGGLQLIGPHGSDAGSSRWRRPTRR